MSHKLSGLMAAVVCIAVASSQGCSSESAQPKPQIEVVQQIQQGAGGGGANDGATGGTVGEGWGTLKGTFVLKGDIPSLPPLATNGKDAPTCNANGVTDTSLIVDSQTKGVKNILVYARKVSRVRETVEAVPAEPAVFDQKMCLFLDRLSAVRVGQTVTLKNSDPVSHNTNINPLGDAGTNQLLTAGSSADYKFGRAQNLPQPVTCNIHPWMKAYIIPRPDAYFAVTKEDGSFEIKDLPAGEPIELQVWHERPGYLEAKPDWTRGRVTVTIPKDGELDLGGGQPIEVSL